MITMRFRWIMSKRNHMAGSVSLVSETNGLKPLHNPVKLTRNKKTQKKLNLKKSKKSEVAENISMIGLLSYLGKAYN